MKISIDTKEDSHEEIRKVIRMLQNLVGAKEDRIYSNQGNIFGERNQDIFASNDRDNSSNVESSARRADDAVDAFGAMFGDNADNGPSEGSSIDASDDREEEKDDIPEVQIFDL